MKVEQAENKQLQIIEASLKRFMHFGIVKTTMNEIADDLSISKASLYYYFPDKTSLIIEVGKHIVSQLLKEQEAHLKSSKNFESGLKSLLDCRIDFGKKYFMMHLGDIPSEVKVNSPEFKEMIAATKKEELRIINEFLNAYQNKGVLKAFDSEKIAQLLMDLITGIWVCEIHLHNSELIPSEEHFETIREKSYLMAEIFHHGIKLNGDGR